eukprot:COSAG02_NODE_1422_length_12685_cov_69.610361_15_plen_132_part_00
MLELELGEAQLLLLVLSLSLLPVTPVRHVAVVRVLAGRCCPAARRAGAWSLVQGRRMSAVPSVTKPVTVTAADEAQIQQEIKLLSPVIPPGAVVLSESTPIAYYLDNVVSGTQQPAYTPSTQSHPPGPARR